MPVSLKCINEKKLVDFYLLMWNFWFWLQNDETIVECLGIRSVLTLQRHNICIIQKTSSGRCALLETFSSLILFYDDH